MDDALNPRYNRGGCPGVAETMTDGTRFAIDGLAHLPQQELKGFAQEVSLLFAAANGGSFIAVLRRFVRWCRLTISTCFARRALTGRS